MIYFPVTLVPRSSSRPTTSPSSSGPLLEVVSRARSGSRTKVFSAIGLLALANGALINMIMASRLLYGMSREGVLPKPFSRASRRTHALGRDRLRDALSAILIVTGDLGKLADTTVALLVCVFIVVNISVLVLRRDRVEEDHFRVPSVFPVLGVGVRSRCSRRWRDRRSRARGS